MSVPAILKKQTITQAALLISVIACVSKVIGFFREVLIANYFGATGQTDAFLVAMLIPGSILGLFASGFSTLVIPFYLERKSRSLEASRRFVDSALLVWGTIFLAVSLLIFTFSPALVHLIAYGFTGERFSLAVKLTRYLVLYGLLNVIIGIFTGLFQAEKQFFFPMLVSFIGNVVVVLCLFLLHRYLGLNSWTVGVTLSSLFSFVAMFFILYRRNGFFHSLHFRQVDWHEIREFALLLFPLVISGGLSMINQIVDKTIGSGLNPGSIAALNFSSRVWNIPISLLAVPIATASFPTFSELALNDSTRAEYESRFKKTLGLCFYLMIPSTLFIYFLSEPIVRLFFERGAFDAQATALTAFVVKMYVIGLFAYAVSPIQAKVFYSFKNTRTPLIISAVCVGLNVVLNILLSKVLGAGGIALATSIVMILNFILFTFFLKKYMNPFPRALVDETVKILISSIPTGIICYFSLPYFQSSTAASLHGFVLLALKLVIVGIFAVLPFLIFSRIFKIESYAFLKSYVRNFLKKRRRTQQ